MKSNPSVKAVVKAPIKAPVQPPLKAPVQTPIKALTQTVKAPAQIVKKEAKVPTKVVAASDKKSGNLKSVPIKEEQKQQQGKTQQIQQGQSVQEQKSSKFEITRTIQLTQLINVLEEDREKDKASFFLDETGNAFNFFKYKGEVIDIPQYIIKEGLQDNTREESVERSRKIFVSALKKGGTLVFFLDKMISNLTEYFKSAQFFNDQESIFTYSKLFQEAFYKTQILKPEEDIDSMGNKKCFIANIQDFKICVLCNIEGAVDPQVLIEKLGLSHIKHCFNASLIK